MSGAKSENQVCLNEKYTNAKIVFGFMY